MPAKTGSRNGLSYGWALGENNWNTGMDGNLTFIDRFGVHLSFKSFLNTPPGSPAAGDCHVIGTVPTGVWVGKAGQVAVYDDGAWRYGIPRTGWRAYCEADDRTYIHDGGWAPTASEWTAETVDQAEAEAGDSTVRRAWTAQRVRQAASAAIAEWWSGATSVFGRALVTVADAAAGRAALGLGNVDNVSAASLRDRTTHTGEQTIGTVTGLQAALDGKQPAGNYVVDGDARLSNAREWTASTVDQAEAEAGAGTTRRAWTAQRVRQAIAAWWASITNIDGKNIGATTAGTGRFTTLTTTGNVGVGTSSPRSLLDLGAYGPTTQLSWHNNATTAYGHIGIQGSSAALGIMNGLRMGAANTFESSISTSWAKSAITLDFGRIRFFTNPADTVTYGTTYTPTERLQITSAGVVDVLSGQIKFPATQNASADANTLDDYREGTFTPTIVGTTTAGVGTYTTQVGRYTKIGNRVLFAISLNWTGHTGTGDLRIDGLPFTPGAMGGSYPVLSVNFSNLNFTAGSQVSAIVNVSSAQILLRQTAPNAAVAAIPMGTSAAFFVSGHYEV